MVAQLDTRQCDRYFGCGLSIETVKPVPIRTVAGYIEVFNDLHGEMVSYALPFMQIEICSCRRNGRGTLTKRPALAERAVPAARFFL